MNSSEKTGEQLLAFIKTKIASGNEQAFRQLFDYYSRKLIQFAFSFVKSKDAALEIVDQVFIRLWKQKENITEINNVKAYLYTAVKNTSLNYLSKKANEQIFQPFDQIYIQLYEEQNPEQQMITSEVYNNILAAVNKLPPRCRMIFKLVREDGLKYKEVAEILNISVNTVDAQMVIAVKRILEAVKGHFDFLSSGRAKKK